MPAAAGIDQHIVRHLPRDMPQGWPSVLPLRDTTLLRRTTRRIDLLVRRTDIAIRIGPLSDSTLHARPLDTSRLHVLASLGYLAERGCPKNVASQAEHEVIGFTHPESLNRWPLRGANGDEWQIAPTLNGHGAI